MIIDAHYHLEKELETVEALIAQMHANNVDRVALIPKMNEPFHLKPIPKKAGELLPRLLMGRLRALGFLLYKSTVTSDGKLSTLGTKYILYHKPDNAEIERAIRRYPDKFLGWIFVNPKTMNAIEEAQRWIGSQGWIGVKTHPFWHSYSVDQLDDVAALCVQEGLPILMHLGGDAETGDYRFLPERHPKLKIIYAHAAVPYYREVWEYIKNRENVYVDLSSSVYMNQQILGAVIKSLGSQKCIYGTDGPYANATEERMLNRIRRLNLSESEQSQVLSANFLNCSGWHPQPMSTRKDT